MVLGGAFGNEIHIGAVEPPVWEQGGYRRERVWSRRKRVASLADGKTPKVDGVFHPEEWQATVHEQTYDAIKRSGFAWGSFVWNMFDFASASRNEGICRG